MPKFGERVFDETDPQQFRVYDAERATGFGRGATFDSLAELGEEMARIVATPIWAALSKHTLQEGRSVELVLGRGKGGKAKIWVDRTPRIIIPPHRFNRWTLIHELAHCARGRLTCTHGPQFTASYLRLLHDCWNPELARQLYANFEKQKVRVHPWWTPGSAIPVPDPAMLTLRLDEGAEAHMAAYRASVMAEFIKLRATCEEYFRRKKATPPA